MISAWFTTSSETDPVIPALIHNEEIRDIAHSLGLSDSDLFRIDIPSGATREGRVVCLVSEALLDTLYAERGDGGNPSAVFSWKETTNATAQSMSVWLLPPRPLYIVAGGTGVAIVEAVDVRWWWKQSQSNALNASPKLAAMFSSDGRWNTGGVDPLTATPLIVVESLRSALPVGTFDIPGSFAPSSTLLNRVADHRFTPECSIAMALDLVLSACGWMMQWDTSLEQLTLVRVGNDIGILNTYMSSNKRAYMGGVEAPSNTATPTDSLATVWYGNSDWQQNAFPNKVTISFPYRSIEGKTVYDNTIDAASDTVKFVEQNEFGWENDVTTDRTRASIGKRLLKEPRSLVATLTTTLNPASHGGNIQSTSPGWGADGFVEAVQIVFEARTTVTHGKTIWAGWPLLPKGSYRCTMLRYSLTYRNGKCVPVALTEAREDDWVLGPNGMPTDDPRELVMSKGMAQARRLSSGVMQLDVAPPNCRVFPAKITLSDPIDAEGNPWQWLYSFEEVEPNPDANTPLSVGLGGWARAGTFKARNMAEAGNQYFGVGSSSNVIAPGIFQSDYVAATIEALPICEDTIVLMVEHFPTAYTAGAAPPSEQAEYWFSMPNAVKVTCTSGA
jgi:hypothetical protein